MFYSLAYINDENHKLRLENEELEEIIHNQKAVNQKLKRENEKLAEDNKIMLLEINKYIEQINELKK